MASVQWLMFAIPFFAILSSYGFINAQSSAQLPAASVTAARSLDALLQDYAYRAFGPRPRTGMQYDGQPPSNISGVRVSVIRLRSGSFRLRGVRSFNEFEIPVGVIEQPYVRRLALVYQNLGNWSSAYYQLPGYTFVAPVLGLLAYEGTNISATNLRELDISASSKPITVRFRDSSRVTSGLTTKCVWFSLDGSLQLNDSSPGNVCTTYRQGHFSIAVNSSELPLPAWNAKKRPSNTWKIIVAAIGGFLALVLVVLLAAWITTSRRTRKLKEMTQHAETGEVLEKHKVGDAQLPRASTVRTRPTLESDLPPHVYAPK